MAEKARLNEKIEVITISPLRKAGGICLIAIGVIGVFLPFIQGMLLILAGAALLGISKERIKQYFNITRNRK